MRGEQSAKKDAGLHRPLAVFEVEGIPFVRCSCRDDFRPQTALWLAEHWQGDMESGLAALRDVIASQRARADEPKCWRSECRNGCYYPDVCSERTRVLPPADGHGA